MFRHTRASDERNSWSGAGSIARSNTASCEAEMNGRRPVKGTYIHDIAQGHVVVVDLPFAS